MPLFEKKKKSGHIKPLSEEDIQKKLYGTFQDANANLLPNDPGGPQPDSSSHVELGSVHDSAKYAESLKAKSEGSSTVTSFSATQKKEFKKQKDMSSSQTSLGTDSYLQDESEDEEAALFGAEQDLFALSDNADDDLESDQTDADFDCEYETDDYVDDETDLCDPCSHATQLPEEKTPVAPPADEPLFRIENPDKPAKKKTASVNAHAVKADVKKHATMADMSSIDEVIQKEESVSFTYDAKPEADIKTHVRSETTSDLQPVPDSTNFRSSFKIDLAEFLDKVKKISPFLIGGLVFFIVFTLVIFNIWIRSSSKTADTVETPSERIAPIPASDQAPTSQPTTPSAIDRTTLPAVTPPQSATSRVPGGTENNGVTVTPVVQPTTDFYSIQVCIYNDSTRAEDLVMQLKDKGLDAFYSRLTTRSDRVLYTVFVGRFPTSQRANEYFSRFKNTEVFQQFPDSFIKLNK
jgi:cell division septation protein DedD